MDWWSSWREFIPAAIGGVLVGVPVYIFGFRQLIAAKNARIEHVESRIRELEKERLPAVLEERKILAEDIERRAREKQESDKIIFETTAKLTKATDELAGHEKTSNAVVEKLKAITDQVQVLTRAFDEKIRTNQTIGVILGTKIIQEAYVEWRLLFESLPTSAPISEFDAYFRGRYLTMSEVLNRLRTPDGELVSLKELALDPSLNEKIAKIAEVNRLKATAPK